MPAPTPQFMIVAERLAAAGLPLPSPLVRAVERDPAPLAVGSHEAWRAWAGAHGYGDQQIVDLLRSITSLVNSKLYLEALAADLAQRHDADGNPVEPVADEHRAVAAQTLLARALNRLAASRGAAIAAVTTRPILSMPRKRG